MPTTSKPAPILRILKTVMLSISSSRTPPRVLLKPPIEVTAHSSFQILTPMQYSETFLGRKPVIETQYSVVVYLKEKVTDRLFRVMEATMTFLHIVEEQEDVQGLIDVPPNKLPPEVVKQLISVALHEGLQLLVVLFDKHMVPIAIPININVEYKQCDDSVEEDSTH